MIVANTLRDRYETQVPFTLTELNDKMLLAAAREAISFYNHFDPLIKREVILSTGYEYTFPGDNAPEAVLRAYFYSLGLFNTKSDYLAYDWEYEKPTLYISPSTYSIVSAYKYTLDNLTTEILDDKKYLNDLIRIYIKLSGSDKRRMATLSELPIDFKGDQFRSEALEDKEKTEQEIMKLAKITY